LPLLPIAPASDAEQPPASRLTARLATAALPLQPLGMTRLPWCPAGFLTLVMIMILNFGRNIGAGMR
jgi:hypothetical protein